MKLENMILSKELLRKTTGKECVKKILDDRMQNIVAKGIEISNADLYNLCLLNREIDEIDLKSE